MTDGVSSFYGFTPFEVRRPAAARSAFVFNAPHSGRIYPPAFLRDSRLDSRAIRRSEDYFVDTLFSGTVDLGAPMLVAHFPRAFLDVNREPFELDPRMFDGPLPPFANISSVRVAGGLGTIPRLVAENMEIYRRRLPVAEAMRRVETIYRPYHDCLRTLIAAAHASCGYAVLIDCHSMPASVRMGGTGRRPDFIIGDRFGTSASQDLTDMAVMLLKEKGYHVTCNKPYAGGFITEHYGRPDCDLHAIQIEINRGLYIDERTLMPKAGFDRLRDDLSAFAASLMTLAADGHDEWPQAAE